MQRDRRFEEQSGREFASADARARCSGSRARVQPRNFSPRTPPPTFNVQRHLSSAQTHRTLRAAAMDTWRTAVAAA
jgi:hypothetical protein